MPTERTLSCSVLLGVIDVGECTSLLQVILHGNHGCPWARLAVHIHCDLLGTCIFARGHTQRPPFVWLFFTWAF
jgi:hypothetical protein